MMFKKSKNGRMDFIGYFVVTSYVNILVGLRPGFSKSFEDRHYVWTRMLQTVSQSNSLKLTHKYDDDKLSYT